ncbi:heavy metal-associated isoprenylated plant protein 43 [Morus notabilis]|uniref:heavy metal-associated isoprenylated plant protein 43 n=1 Tax=Morus notabilis TaxID=981085 RepID=UPI000CED399C|nr:heavy metal-associated isoprenylated plant protein 43 [Morus notabilis]
MSTVKKTELKVNVNCEKCKKDVLKAVTKLSGINQVSVDATKGTLTVIGDVDPVMIVKQVRKARKCAEIISVGPPKPPEKKSPEKYVLLPSFCKDCQLVAVSFAPYGGGSACNIL